MGMPFIIQCPHAGCGKYMLVEDSERGSTIKCLVCKQAIKLDPTNTGETPGATAVAPAKQPAPTPPRTPATQPAKAPGGPGNVPPGPLQPAQRENVRVCTKCQTPLKVPAGAGNQKIRCPKCQNIF